MASALLRQAATQCLNQEEDFMGCVALMSVEEFN